MDHGVTTMMKVREMAERHLTKVAVLSALGQTLTDLFMMVDPITTGMAENRALLFLSLSFCDW